MTEKNLDEWLETLEELSATKSIADYDDEYILKNLMSGKTREELAEELNHKSYRTIDMYMRRRGYAWDSYKRIYVLKPEENLDEKNNSSNYNSSYKVDKIIRLFDSGYDPKEVAKKVGMSDHKAMALYMEEKGYMWSGVNKNYVLKKGKILDEPDEIETTYNSNVEESINPINDKSNIEIYNNNFDENSLAGFQLLQKLMPMLEMLYRNKTKLAEVLSINDGQTIPRYMIGGISITKSICMSHSLSELIKEFSKEKNISQREIFEVSIIDFLKKYGYEKEINTLFME